MGAIDFTGYVNFRDLGGHLTPTGRVRFGRVYRSDSLAHVDQEHVDHLVLERGIRTVVDLRGATEIDAYPNQPMRDAGVTIHHIPLIDPGARPAPELDWKTMGLVGLYQFILETAGPRFVEALAIISDPANHPLVFHCAAGKDRAGLIAATVLGTLGVSDDEIITDYARTASALDALRARARARAAAMSQPTADRFMTAEADTMRELIAWLRDQHGGFEDYLLGHGLPQADIDRLRAELVEPR